MLIIPWETRELDGINSSILTLRNDLRGFVGDSVEA